MTDREANRTLALIAGTLALAGPRRTRPLAGFLYGVWLSRAQSAQLRTAHIAGQATILRLFDEKTSVGERVGEVERRLGYVERLKACVADLELVAINRDGRAVVGSSDALIRMVRRVEQRARNQADA